MILLTGILFQSPAFGQITPVSPFSLERYLGKWYEIARLPTSFERGLSHVTATYTLRNDGKVKVLNEGIRENGNRSEAIGKAKFAGKPDTAHLKVSFFGPFYADYVVFELDMENYSYAMVASSMKYLWILSRTPQLDQSIKDKLVEKARSAGFDISRLIFTTQD